MISGVIRGCRCDERMSVVLVGCHVLQEDVRLDASKSGVMMYDFRCDGRFHCW